MSDPRHIVESIRFFLNSQGNTVSAELIAVAADYAELCRQANLRLHRCAEFLREGFRGEALAYAGTRPPLVDLVSELRFRELPDWERACTSLGLARPVRLETETANSLLDAAHRQEPLKELLAKHRYLALARADLGSRLEVLRQLVAADPTCPCWRHNLDELTQARMATLRNDAMAAIRNGDLVSVNKLLAEANAGTTALPSDLKDALARASAALHESTAVSQLQALVPQIRQAMAAGSLQQCRQVFAEWSRVVREFRITVPPDLRQEIMPLSRWLDELDENRQREREFAIACQRLREALEAKAPAEELTPLYRAALGCELELPGDLESAYREVNETARQLAFQEKRRDRALAITLVAAVVIAVILLVVVLAHRH